jgi:valyl-tRNA synthetase
LGSPQGEITLVRDEDVLDTWFSSGLFPFSVMGWPEYTADLKAFYPTSLLETGLDILFFWVARMVMMGLELTDTLPFHTVFLHAMVRDKDGRKMSKSLGNVIDPLEVINGCSLESLQERLESGNLPAKEVERAKKANELEFPEGIPECGSDALRFGLLAYTVQGRDISLDVTRVVGLRMFCNKLWNATRFALQFVADFAPTATLLDDLMSSNKMAIRDKFMISRLMKGVETVNDCLAAYRFGEAQQAIYALWLDEICAIYLELIKPVVYDTSEANKEQRWAAQATLWVSMEIGLRLLHPMMPFVTEELWQRLPGRGSLGAEETVSIMIAKYPEVNPSYKNDDCESSMAHTMKVVEACRALRASYNIAHKVQTRFFIRITGPGEAAVKNQIDDIKTLGKASLVEVNTTAGDVVGTVIVDDTLTVLMDVKGLVDYKVEIARLEKSMKVTIPAITTLEQKMAAEGYEEKVPQELKEANAKKLESLLVKKTELEETIANLEKLQLIETSS